MSILDKYRKKKEEETYRFKGKPMDRMQRVKEQLEREKERMKLRNEIQESKKELRQLRHPTQTKAVRGVERAGGKIVKFMGETIREGARVYSVSKSKGKTARRKIQRHANVRLSGVRGGSPFGTDISMAGGISRNQWGGQELMNVNFFGSGEQRDLLGSDSRDMDNLVGSSMKKKNRDYF